MTFYLHPQPYRRMARQLAASNERALGVNIREEDDAYILSALVPGLKADDLNIQVLEDALRIEGEYKRSSPVDKLNESEYLLQELPHGSFKRTLRLPTVVDADQVEAKITDGVLTLKLPKAESARPKKINITAK